MRFVLISHQYYIGGGEVVSFQLADMLTKMGEDIIYLSGNPSMGEEESGIYTIRFNQKQPWRILHKYLVKFPILYRYFGRSILNNELDSILSDIQPDIINIHGIASTHWDVSCIDVCLRHAPVVWTLHDMSSFTGRCGAAYECRQYISGCTETCPDLHIPFLIPKKASRSAYIEKKKLIENNQCLSAITPSQWLYEQAVNGMWKHNPVTVIPNGVPLDIYFPEDKIAARVHFDIPQDAFVLMTAAANLNDKNKGVDLLIKALSMINHQVVLLVMGKGLISLCLENVTVIHAGFLFSHEKRMAYSAADIVVLPSLAETQGMVFVESIACGTPAIVFPTTALLEGMRPGVTGWLCDEVSAESLASTIDKALSEIKNGTTTFQCRKIAEKEYDLQLQAERYVQFFKEESQRCQ